MSVHHVRHCCIGLIGTTLTLSLALAGSAQTTSRPVVVRKGIEQPSKLGKNLSAVPSKSVLDEQAIKALLERQTSDWNHGDLDAFAQGYKHSPDILFMSGNSIRRGYDQMLARYKQSYPTRERMGKLTFSELEVQPLGPNFATTTGHFHLERTSAGGGNADGFFLLVLEKTPEGWKVVRDDTTSLPAATK